MRRAAKGLRLHIGIFGRRNAGKSSLLNALTRQQVAIVSEVPGTTTDPVEKPMELQPLGPVLFIDTAGVDDEGALGDRRVAATRKVFDRCDLAVILAVAGTWTAFEDDLLAEFGRRGVPLVVCINKCDLAVPDPALLARLAVAGQPAVCCTLTEGRGLEDLRAALIGRTPAELLAQPPLAADLLPSGGLAVLVVPIDKEAPKGRLIQPQVQVIRDLLDHERCCLVVRERELREALARLVRPPDLVITDSQAFLKVAGDAPAAVPLTSFSILLARAKGNLAALAAGTRAIDRLQPGDRVLIAESCSHHPIADDIGRVKIPRWLDQYVGGALAYTVVQGHDFPADLAGYSLVVHCGACMFNRREFLVRQEACASAGVPMTNYGLVIAACHGLLDRVLAPFGDLA